MGKRIHFVGIGGSGISGIAVFAKRLGFQVSGCDLEEKTAYLEKVKEAHITVERDHNKNHVINADLVVVSPAILYVNGDHPEVVEAKRQQKLITWEKFLGDYLQKEKNVIGVSGTHGKSTTTAMLGRILEDGGMDPSVVIGATVKEWDANFRVGEGNILVIESDEFNDNFLNYNPNSIILNNAEMDHADFFEDQDAVFNSFSKFLLKLSGEKLLIINQDSEGVRQILNLLPRQTLNEFQIWGYTLTNSPRVKIANSVKIEILKSDKLGTSFRLFSSNLRFKFTFRLTIPGRFNVSNATGAIIVAKIYGISDGVIRNTLKSFRGVGRRLEFIGTRRGVSVYDDYAHHPTAVKATLGAIRQKYPTSRIWAIDEPHSYSRTKALMQEYKNVFDEADRVIITPIYKARDNDTLGIREIDLVAAIKHSSVSYIDSFSKVVDTISRQAKRGDVILVMGAGKSYQLSRDILHNL